MITAHGGALGTGRNTYKYFEEMTKHPEIEAIEVDIRRAGGKLWLGHVIVPFSTKKRIPLEFVLDFCKQQNKRVNCDVKSGGMVADVVKAAKSMNAVENIYFTGSVKKDEIGLLDGADVYLNAAFFPYRLNAANVPKIAEYVRSLGSPCVKGLNVNYKFCDENLRGLLVEAGLGLSVYTVDDLTELQKIVNAGYDNVTTNQPLKAYEFLKQQ